MAGYTIDGRGDLDALFMARVNAARAAVGYQIDGTDIANRYEPIGAGTPIAATGYLTDGVDLSQLFRSIGQPLNTFAMVAGFGGAGTQFGYLRGSYGTLTPNVWNGANINGAYDVQPSTFRFVVAATLAQNAFTSITTNGKTFASAAAASFSASGGVSTWFWNTAAAGYVNGGGYSVVIN